MHTGRNLDFCCVESSFSCWYEGKPYQGVGVKQYREVGMAAEMSTLLNSIYTLLEKQCFLHPTTGVQGPHYRCPGHGSLWILLLSNIHDGCCIFLGLHPNRLLIFLITFWDQLAWECLLINYFYLFHSDCPLIRAILKKDNILHLRLYMQVCLKYSHRNNMAFQLKKKREIIKGLECYLLTGRHSSHWLLNKHMHHLFQFLFNCVHFCLINKLKWKGREVWMVIPYYELPYEEKYFYSKFLFSKGQCYANSAQIDKQKMF